MGKPPILMGGQSTRFKVRVAGEAGDEAGTGWSMKGLGHLLCVTGVAEAGGQDPEVEQRYMEKRIKS